MSNNIIDFYKEIEKIEIENNNFDLFFNNYTEALWSFLNNIDNRKCDDLMFIAISYCDDYGQISHSSPITNSNYSQIINKFFNQIYDDASKGASISFTDIISTKYKKSLILFKNAPNDNTKCFEIGEILNHENINIFTKTLGIEKETDVISRTMKILESYKSLFKKTSNTKENFVTYLLRPNKNHYYKQIAFIGSKKVYPNEVISAVEISLSFLLGDLLLKKLEKQQLKTAIISILVDSYAHNISAHSLSALKWWFELRHKILDKRFYVPEYEGLSLSKFQPEIINISQKQLEKTTQKYYAALGLTDSTYNKDFFSLFDFLQFCMDPDFEESKSKGELFTFQNANQKYANDFLEIDESIKGRASSSRINENGLTEKYIMPEVFAPRFTSPLEYALYPFFRFLRDKGAFWSGVTRDMAFGGESKTWFKILWEDFANNPLYLGTIAKSEGITKLKINLAVKHNNSWITGRFVTIDISLLEYEERIANNPRQKIEYQQGDFDLIKKYLTNIGLKEEQVKDKSRDKIDDPEALQKLDECLNNILLKTGSYEEEHCETHDTNNNAHCESSHKNYIDGSFYSKYAFVRLGKCFSHFREILNSEDYSVFLPGGIVGEHALFTIFENQLRNIKHYKDYKELKNIKAEGIDYWISIEDEGLIISNKQENKRSELFKVKVWLGHETSMFQTGEQNKNVLTWDKVSQSTEQPIIDSNGNPKMGGNSQDKACAAMLFNNKFISVDDKSDERSKIYYPWLYYSVNTDKYPKNSGTQEDQPYSRIESRINGGVDYDENLVKARENMADNKLGFLKKQFYLWRSYDYIIITDENDFAGENISRFKFVLISGTDPKLINSARQAGVVRLISGKIDDLKDKINEIEDDLPLKTINRNVRVNQDIAQKVRDEKLKTLYYTWLQQWLSFDENYSVALDRDQNTYFINLLQKEGQAEASFSNNPLSSNNIQKISLTHGGGNADKWCNVRSHGNFWNKYFHEITSKQPEDLLKEHESTRNLVDNDFLLFDFVEVVATRIVVFDNRLKDRMPKGIDKTKVFEQMLNLVIREEENMVTGKEEKYIRGTFLKKLKGLEQIHGIPNVLIVHLSYIESMGYKEGEKGSMNEFIKRELNGFIDKPNFLFVIVTGRGRNSWKDDLLPEYSSFTLFKPIESFLHAIESGVSYNDNFDVKHNIIKVIFGS
jgi:hypothetical protein